MNNILEINNIFKKIPEYAKKYNKKSRDRKVNIADAAYCRFAYSQKNKTKENITSELNFINKLEDHADRTSYFRKEESISINLYKNLYEDVKNVHKKIINEHELRCIPVDGTYGHTEINNSPGKLQTSLSLGLFDATHNVPVELKFYGHLSKNKEVSKFIEYVKEHKFNNVVFVCDRAYFNYEEMKYLNENNMNFVIRIKDNADILKEYDQLNKNNVNYDNIIYLQNHCRVVKSEHFVNKTVTDNNDKSVKITEKSSYVIITNLTNIVNFSDEKILDIYRSRWKVEIFFKYVKYNFKLEKLLEKNTTAYDKLYYCELIITYISNLIQHYFVNKKNKKEEIINKKNGTCVKCTVKVCDALLISGIFDKLLHKIIHGKLSRYTLLKFWKSYIKQIKNEVNRSFPRVSKTPFTKWYVKSRILISQYAKILEAIDTNTIDSLSKNLKRKALFIKKVGDVL